MSNIRSAFTNTIKEIVRVTKEHPIDMAISCVTTGAIAAVAYFLGDTAYHAYQHSSAVDMRNYVEASKQSSAMIDDLVIAMDLGLWIAVGGLSYMDLEFSPKRHQKPDAASLKTTGLGNG